MPVTDVKSHYYHIYPQSHKSHVLLLSQATGVIIVKWIRCHYCQMNQVSLLPHTADLSMLSHISDVIIATCIRYHGCHVIQMSLL